MEEIEKEGNGLMVWKGEGGGNQGKEGKRKKMTWKRRKDGDKS